MKKLVSFLFRLMLYVILTFVFVVIFEHGLAQAPSKMVSEFYVLKQEVEAALPKR